MREDGAAAGYPSLGSFYDRAPSFGKGAVEGAGGDRINGATAQNRAPDETARLLPKLLAELGLSAEDYRAALVEGRRNGMDAASELVANGRVGEAGLAVAIGFALGLPAERILPGDIAMPDPAAHARREPPRFTRTCDRQLRTKIFLAPRLEDLDGVARFLAAHPQYRSLTRITTAGELARHREGASVAARSEAARLSLARDRPAGSARQVLTGAQGFALALLLMAVVLVMLASPSLCLAALHLVGLPFFSGCVALRLRAAAALGRKPADVVGAGMRHQADHPGPPHPTYTVLVALYRESDVVGDLVTALGRLRWPRSRLDVKLVCEGDDLATIAAARQACLGRPEVSIVIVPPSLPRTKPKALNFALPLAAGDFVVLYDAEDRPDPWQLEAAWQVFRDGDDRLGCLQAPLVVSNGEGNWLAGHFALEYAALFRGLLPWLAARRLPMPLGGTSNHFRTSALLAVGGWDSHNVTEDADLGIRLCRSGYRIGTIAAPTYEEAPERWTDWRNQRTRWMKGWFQTWLVHMRDPVRLARDLGPSGFLAFQFLFFGMIASSLIQPLFLACLGYTLFTAGGIAEAGLGTKMMIGADALMLALGYASFGWLAVRALDRGERPDALGRLSSVPVYWLLIGIAALRALGQLLVNPHGWEKTPHGKAARADAAPVRREPIFDVA